MVEGVAISLAVCFNAGMNDEANRVIDALGGTGAVARMCEVNDSAVSQWRVVGIPRARLMYLRAVRPDLFGQRRRKPAKHHEPARAE